MVHAKGFSAARNVGRLIEVRFGRLTALSECDELGEQVSKLLDELGGVRAVFCTDWRAITVLSPAIGERVVALMRALNPRVERSAVLLEGGRPTFALQAERILKEAQNPDRRAFTELSQVDAWLGAVLTHRELARAREFLASSLLQADSQPPAGG